MKGWFGLTEKMGLITNAVNICLEGELLNNFSCSLINSQIGYYYFYLR